MAEFHNRIDLALVSTGPTEIIDICEPGGIQNAHVVIEGGDGLVDIEGCATDDGVFTTIETVTISGEPWRARIPLSWPRFIRLKAAGATLSIRA